MSNYINTFFPNFGKVPHIKLLKCNSPIHDISKYHHSNQKFWLKDDGATGEFYGGNKLRNLEFLLGDALEKRSKKIISFGSIESNLARAVAIYGNEYEFQVKLYLCNISNTNEVSSKLKIFDQYRSKATEVPIWACFLMNYLFKTGFSNNSAVYIIPIGGLSMVGCLGSVNAILELIFQIENGLIEQPDIIILPIGSGGTVAGFLAVLSMLKYQIKIIGINISTPKTKKQIFRISKKIISQFEQQDSKIDPNLLEIDSSYIGEGYGRSSDETLKIAKRLWDSNKIYLDQFYSAKTMLASINYSQLYPSKSILFWNTSNGIGRESNIF